MQSSTEMWFHLESKNWSNSKVTHLRSLTSITFIVGGRSRWVQTSRLHRTTDLRRIVFSVQAQAKPFVVEIKVNIFFSKFIKRALMQGMSQWLLDESSNEVTSIEFFREISERAATSLHRRAVSEPAFLSLGGKVVVSAVWVKFRWLEI